MRQMEIGPHVGRNRALGASGRPDHMKEAILRLLRFFQAEKALFAAALSCSIIHTVSALAASYLLRPIINRFIYFAPEEGSPAVRYQGLFLWLVLLAGVYALSVATHWIQQRLMLQASQKTLARMRRDLFAKLQRLPVRYYDEQLAGDIMSRFTNDVDTIGEMLNTTLIQVVTGLLTIIGTVILMTVTNPLLGIITILASILLTFLSKSIMKRGREAFSVQQKRLGQLGGFVQETISGQKVVKVFHYEEQACREFAGMNRQLCLAQQEAQFRSGIMGPVTHQLCNMVYALIASVGGILVAAGRFDIGGLTVSLNYSRQFNRPINEVSMQLNTVFAALAGAERVFAVLDEAEEGEGEAEGIRPECIRGEVILEGVSFGYRPEIPVLKKISLYARPGQKIAFVGSTGAGKTTVTNLLSRFYEIREGRITIDGIPIETIDRGCLRSNIAMVLQDTHLFTGTVRENIRYGRQEATDEEVVEAAKAASAHTFIRQLEKGYDTLLERDGANLSQGQRQLISIARAAISKAPILILDEATSSVDTRTERQIERGMDTLMKERTTFVIAHRLSTVREADAIMVLEKGRIVERGTHRQLLEAGGRYADLYREKIELE